MSRNKLALVPLLVSAILSLALFSLSFASSLSSDNTPVNSADRKGDLLVATEAFEISGATIRPLAAPEMMTPLGAIMMVEIEPNNTYTTANPLPGTQAVVSGNIWPVADLDYFSFSGNAGDRVYAATMTSFAAGSTDSTLTLFDTDGTTIIEVDVNDGSFAASSSSIAGATLPANGTYYLQVRATSATSSMRPYHLYFKLQSGAPTLETEPNNLADGGQPLPPSSWVSGAINPAGDNDVFTFALNAGDTVYLSLDLDPERDGGTTWNGRVGLGAFGNPPLILVVNDANTTSPNSEAFFFTVKESGTYYAYVDPATAGTGDPAWTYNLSVAIFPSTPATDTCTTYTSTDVPLVIPTGPGLVESTLTVPGNPIIADLDVTIVLTHTNMPDLDVVLLAPGGNQVVLFNDLGVSTQQQMNLTLDDEAAIPMGSYTVMSGMVYQPPSSRRLDWFDYQNAGGTWTLQVYDDLANNDGVLQSWSMTICEPPPPPSCPVGYQPVTVFSTDFEADDGGFTSSGVQNEWQWGVPNFAPITTCSSGANCWVTDLTGTYNASSNQDLFAPAIDLSGYSGPVIMRWAQKHQIENANWDNAFVDVQEVGGANPTRLWEWLGPTMSNLTVGSPTVTIPQSAGWSQRWADISAYAGQSVEGRFNLSSDSSINFAGLAIDDFSITACQEVSPPAISLTKTVGTTPGVCATMDEITVDAGTEVYYCYVVENTGEVTLNFHDLVDSELGVILNDFPYVLAPGAFSPEVIVPQVVVSTVTNEATWTALTALGDYIVDDTIPLNWEDISGTGTPVTLTDDSVSGALPIGFSFEFYGENYSDVYASSNGFITVLPGQPNGCCTGGILPSPTTPNGVIAGWWEDLNPSAGGTVHYQTLGTAPNRVFIVQYTDIPHFGGGNLVSKQYKLFEGSNIIEVHYLAAPSDGGTHSAGIENATGTLGIQYYRGTASLPTPLAVQYALTTVASASDTATATVNVLVQNIDVDPLSLSSTQPANTVTNQTLTIANTGDGTLIWNIAEEPTGQAAVTTGGSRAVVSEDASATDDGSRQHTAAAPELTGWRYPEAVLYDNGPLITHPGGGAGGADVSALQTAIGMDTFGFGHQLSAGNRVADDFTVTGGGWFVDTMTFFAYQTGSSTTSTINHINLRIWDGPPNDPGSSVVFGDTTTNRLVSSTWSNIYRTLDTALTDGTRPIMASTATVNTFLPAGTYWVDWQVGGTLASGPWAPPISILDQTTTGNALQWTGAWAPVVDGGIATPQGFPFIVEGLADCTDLVDVPWLSVSPTSGSNTGGTNTPVTATFDSTGLAAGTYTANLCVFSNDPDSGPGNGTNLVIVPVELEVEPFVPAPAIEIMKTVGTAPGVCAATSTITVPAGTTVYYCYTVMNTGNVTLNLHDLSDNELGPIFTGLSYALAPGESVNTVAAGLSIPAVINQPTTNTATWTAYNAGPSNVAIATATATVNVTYQLYLPIIVK